MAFMSKLESVDNRSLGSGVNIRRTNDMLKLQLRRFQQTGLIPSDSVAEPW